MNIDFKKLKLKDMYKWPMMMQAIAGTVLTGLLLVLGFFFIILDKYSEYDTVQGEEVKLKTEFVEKTKQSVNLLLYKEQLVEITNASDALLKQLPNKSEVEKLLIDINQSGVSRGLKFELFKPNSEKMTEYYAELPIAITVSGTYDSIGSFASDVSQLSRVVILNEINLQNNPDGTLSMSGIAKTFRYLDQDEIDKQKAEKRSKLKAGKMGETK
jgi:type IV pilus assembly protein PilO